jgi:hypothetical protein
MELPSGAKQAAEKLRFSDKVAEIRPSGAKARAFPALFGTTEEAAEKSEARTEFSEDHSAEDKQTVEKPGISGEIGGEHPSGPKGHADFAALTARLKSCPDTKRPFESASTSFSAASEVVP